MVKQPIFSTTWDNILQADRPTQHQRDKVSICDSQQNGQLRCFKHVPVNVFINQYDDYYGDDVVAAAFLHFQINLINRKSFFIGSPI